MIFSISSYERNEDHQWYKQASRRTLRSFFSLALNLGLPAFFLVPPDLLGPEVLVVVFAV